MSKDLSFSRALERLETIISELENPNLDLEDGIKLLEEGVKLHKSCKDKLTLANAKIRKIVKEDSNSAI